MNAKWVFVLLVVCLMCSFTSAFIAYHFYYLAQGIRPLLIDEPDIWLARAEFIFAIVIAILGFVGIYAITKVGHD